MIFGYPKFNFRYPKMIYGYPKMIYGYPKRIYGYPKRIYGYPKMIYGYPKCPYMVTFQCLVTNNDASLGLFSIMCMLGFPLSRLQVQCVVCKTR